MRFRSTSDNGGGVIHGSASEATLASILAARWRITGGAVNIDGDTSKLVAYATSQAHSSIEKGLRIAGIGTDADADRRPRRSVRHGARVADRADRRRSCRRSRAVLGVRDARHDELDGLRPDRRRSARSPAREGLWLHVDAAMSGIGALVPEHRWINDGLELADSYCTNPHKWMGVVFDCDLFYTSDRRALLGALSILPEYLRSAAAESGAAIDYRDWQIPLGRRFRSLKLWFTLRTDGVAPGAGDDPPARRRSPGSSPSGSPPTTASRSSPRRRSTCCASACAATTRPRRCGHRRTDRRGQRHRRGPVHPHRPRRPSGPALLHRRPHHRAASRRVGLAPPPTPRPHLTDDDTGREIRRPVRIWTPKNAPTARCGAHNRPGRRITR